MIASGGSGQGGGPERGSPPFPFSAFATSFAGDPVRRPVRRTYPNLNSGGTR